MTTNAILQQWSLRLAMSVRCCGNDRHSTFLHNAPSWRLANVGLVALAVICCCSAALGQQSLEAQQLEKVRVFSGRWTTESSSPDGLTRLEIGSNASTIFIKAWAMCRQVECYWGERSIDISAAEAGVLSVTWARAQDISSPTIDAVGMLNDAIKQAAASATDGAPTTPAAVTNSAVATARTGAPGRIDTLKISPLPDRRLRVAWHTAYADARLPQDHTQEFVWLSFPSWGRTTSSNVPIGAWSALSSSVVVLFAKQPAGHLAPVGFGLLVRHNLVATSYNVAKNASQLQARLAARSALWPVLEVVKVDEAHNVALVRVEGLRGWPLSLYDRSEVAVKDEVFVITNVTDGTISSVAVRGVRVVNGVSHIEITTPFSPIESGAPVFNKYGSVVGISASNPEGAKKPGLVIHARRLTALMPSLAQPHALATAVDSRPVMLNNPTPRYTEEARRRNVSGKVTLRVLVGADGEVKEVNVISGLPYGLSEQAVEALRKTRFKPAMKDGRPVEYWLNGVSVEFNIRY